MTEVLIEYVQLGAELGRTWGPLIVLVLMAVESSFIPFPSEVVMIPAGFMAARGEFLPPDPVAGLVVAVLAGILGSLVGAFINYGLSLKLGRPFLYRYGRYFFLSAPSLERAEELFRRHGEITTFVCRLIPAIRQLISIPAGLSRMRFGTFALFTGLGAGIWVIILGLAGFALGKGTREMSYEEHPFLRPMYDALYEMLGAEQVARLIEKNIIEVAPLAFMRGRSLNDSFVILDEAQNTSVAQMKMFLTRIGFGSRSVVTGDITQIDLPSGQQCGLKNAMEILADVDGVAFTYFTPGDVVRHELVQRIVEAYEADGNGNDA